MTIKLFFMVRAAITNISKYIPTSILKELNSDLQKQNKYISGLCKKFIIPTKLKLKIKIT